MKKLLVLLLIGLCDLALWAHRRTWCVAVQARGVNSQLTTTHFGTVDVGACACGLARAWDDRPPLLRSGDLIDCSR